MEKKYNEIQAKDNMQVKVDNNDEVIATVEKKRLEKIVTVQPQKVKRSLFGRLITGVMGPEGLPGIGAYVNEEIIKPAIKNLIFDAITSAASRAMYGRTGGPYRPSGQVRNGNQYPPRPVTNYSKQYDQRPQPEERKPIRHARYDVGDFLITDRNDAANILTSLVEYADRYDVVSIADFYDLIGIAAQHTDHNYGWTIDTISHATIMPVRGGFIIKFPPVEVI